MHLLGQLYRAGDTESAFGWIGGTFWMSWIDRAYVLRELVDRVYLLSQLYRAGDTESEWG